jgi:hypothetical protein
VDKSRGDCGGADVTFDQVHKERGIPLLYCSDTYAGDVPYYIPNPLAEVYGEKDDGMLMIPYSLCTNDHRCE